MKRGRVGARAERDRDFRRFARDKSSLHKAQGELSSHVMKGVAPFPGAVAIGSPRASRLAAETDDLVLFKPRPVVLVQQRRDGVWSCWGLTSLERFADGRRRTRAAGLVEVGLARGYIWGHFALLAPGDLLGVVWAAPYDLLDACVSTGSTLHSHPDMGRWVYETHHAHVDAGWYWPKPT